MVAQLSMKAGKTCRIYMGQLLVWYFIHFFPSNLYPLFSIHSANEKQSWSRQTVCSHAQSIEQWYSNSCDYNQFYNLECSPPTKKYCTLWKYCCEQTCILCVLLQNMRFLGLRAISCTQVLRQIQGQGTSMMHPKCPRVDWQIIGVHAHFLWLCHKNVKMTGGIPEVRSDKSLILLTFDIWYLTFDISFLTFYIWDRTFYILHSTNGPMDNCINGLSENLKKWLPRIYI